MFHPKLERIGDEYIMEVMSNITPRLLANQLRQIFNWRLYYQVNTLSDLCNAKGDQILDIYLKHPTANNVNQIRTDRISKLKWPIQSPPESTKSFKLWVRSLRICFLHESGSKIRKPLGPWTASSNDPSSHWDGYMSADHTTFISRSSNSLTVHSNKLSYTPGTTIFSREAEQTPISTIPSKFFPIDNDRKRCDQTIKVLHSNRDMQFHQPNIVSSYEEVQIAIFNSPSWQRHLLQHFRIHGLEHLQQCLSSMDTKVYLVSDGGLKDQKGSFGVSASKVPHQDTLNMPTRTEAKRMDS